MARENPAIGSPPDPIVASRLSAQLLSTERGSGARQVVERLLAVQAQDPRGFRLAIRARTEGLAASDVDRELTGERSLVVTWLNRGTLHLVRSEDLPWLHALTTPRQERANERRLREEGVSERDAERALALVERWLAEDGPLPGEELRGRIAATGIRSEGQALYHVLFKASQAGLVVRGPVVEGRHAFVLVREWLGEAARAKRRPAPVDRDAALAELARRYLAGHGPAGERDLARWSGLGLRDVRAGLNSIAGELEEVEAPAGGERADRLLALRGRADPGPLPPPRLLGPFDPLLHGWVEREPIVGEHRELVTKNGIFRPFALVDGRAAGSWRMPAGEVVLEPFGRLRAADRRALEREAADVKRFLAG